MPPADKAQWRQDFQRDWPLSALPIMMVCCAGGLTKLWPAHDLYTFGVGYGFGMIVQGILVLLMRPAGERAAPALYIVYGVRLSFFLLIRDHSNSYRGQYAAITSAGTGTPLPVQLCVVMFVAMIQQATLITVDTISLHRGMASGAGKIAFAVALLGFLLQTGADEQKLYYKVKNPDLPVMKGLYGLVRHPNYLGEIVFWLGVAGMCLASSELRDRKIVWTLGPLIMCCLMVSAAHHGDVEGMQKYADMPEYMDYVKSTWSLLPRV
eukprot:TRINITY_DN51680_c0_g1_i2.p2 TRINITY_DN51680_c0_g1~~TRINITY_DN51680_c0_g1_i2.p2  ORF type:complete len:266 (+),score=50.94 TRINITY_DN51680_c0_g1_i2:89-886(+)